MTRVALPTAAMRDRLQSWMPRADISVWSAADDALPCPEVDLLVFPYMAPLSLLSRIPAHSVSVIQAQTLGFDGAAEYLASGITFCNAVGVHESSTGELALALILAAQRGIPDAVRDAATGTWAHRRRPGLAGQRVLVIGAGGVGKEVTRRLAPFGAKVIVVARTPRAGVRGLDELPVLLSGADIVVLAVPLTAETHHLADDTFLDRMRDGALLVNISRGAVVDTDALTERVRAGAVRAALDVTDPEPLPAQHPLWSLPGAIITPHLGGDTDAMDGHIDRLIVEQVRRLDEGLPPLHAVIRA
jgi:phosphoglycerate dehydrogenase-like enzyme